MTSWAEHSAAAEEMGVSQREAYETFDSPFHKLHRLTRDRIEDAEPCGRCGITRTAAELVTVLAKAPHLAAGSMRIKLCTSCRPEVEGELCE